MNADVHRVALSLLMPAIIDVFIIAYVVKSVRIGRIRSFRFPFDASERATDPFGFWTVVLVDVVVAVMLCIAGISGYLSP